MEFNPKLLDRFKWARYDTLKRGMFCSYCEKFGTVSQSSGGVWRDSPFSNWKKAWEKSRAHEKTQVHSLPSYPGTLGPGTARNSEQNSHPAYYLPFTD